MSGPRWFVTLSEALAKSPKSTVYTVATVDGSITPTPKVRNIVHREFLIPSPQLPLLVSTTDVRSPKVHELTSIAGTRVNAEIAWWIEDVSEQYRLSGMMHILPHPRHPLTSSFPRERLAPLKDGEGRDFDWEKERVSVFNDKMGASLRAGFAHPTPGAPLKQYEDAESWTTKLPKSYEVDEGDTQTRELVEEALDNFSLMILEPLAVERVELGIVPNRRTKYELVEGVWTASIVVP